MVPPAEPRSYYGQPVLAPHVWTWEIQAYFFAGGMAGAAAPLAAGARLIGNDRLGRRAAIVALVGTMASPPLLIADLGRPARFLRMLRVFKPTSPMSVGTWILSTFGPAAGVAAGWQVAGFPGPRIGVPAQAVAAALGPALSTYTAVLIANTAVPVWHDARRELPFVFAASSLSAAGGAAAAITPLADAGPARVLGAGGACLELAVSTLMERRLDPRVRASYERDGVRTAHRASRLATVAGALLLAVPGRRSRLAQVAGGLALIAGSGLTRRAVVNAGTVSAQEPEQTVGPQRDRVAARGGVGA